tara:strand:+ start:27379 stop:29076 length:1698 start_codon:yes stop_codon:yes gene_type:complete
VKFRGSKPSAGISRRDFLKGSAILAAGLSLPGCSSLRTLRNTFRSLSGNFDVILRNGTVVDGTGEASYRADIGIQDDEIAAIGNLSEAHANTVFDCSKYHIFPGFVDLHSHSDYVLFEDRRALSKIFQGVTTEIVGQDGRSPGPFTPKLARAMHSYMESRYGKLPFWDSVKGYYDALEDLGPTVNVKTMIGSGVLRQGQAGYTRRKLDKGEMRTIRGLIDDAMDQGACGLSSGLEYMPNAHSDTDELIAMCEGVGLYSTHMRNEDDRVLEAMIEAIRIAREGNVRLNISHFKLQGQRNWDKANNAFHIIAEARSGGLKLTMDRYPYTAYHTALNSLFPIWAQKKGLNLSLARGRDGDVLRRQVDDKISGIGGYDRIRLGVVYSQKYKQYSGKTLAEIARSKGMPPYELMFDIASSGSASTVVFAMSEENLIRIYRDPFSAVASDGSGLSPGMKGNPHPRNYGTFSHFLSYFVQKKGIMSLEEAVRKCSSLPAEIAGLEDRGRIEPGWKADLAIFDMSRVQAYANYDNPIRLSAGVEGLLVNGRFVIRNGRFNGSYPGRPLRERTV